MGTEPTVRESRLCSACHTELHQGLFAKFLLTLVLHRGVDLPISFSDAQAGARAGVVDAGFPGLQSELVSQEHHQGRRSTERTCVILVTPKAHLDASE